MPDQPRAIRNAAKALIIRDSKLLTIAKRDKQGMWYLLPGGGQKHGETLKQTLQRECLEEIGTTVEIGKLLFVREFIAKNHLEIADDWTKNYHAIDFIFNCYVPEEYVVKNGILPDEGQEQVEWLPIASLSKYRLYPSPLKELLLNLTNSSIYLGDVH
jgi:8-oxo-dGTP diphosphatase